MIILGQFSFNFMEATFMKFNKKSIFQNFVSRTLELPEEAGRAPGVEPNSIWQQPRTRPLHTAYSNSQTKLILNYFKRGSTLNLNGFSVKIFFYIRY